MLELMHLVLCVDFMRLSLFERQTRRYYALRLIICLNSKAPVSSIESNECVFLRAVSCVA